MVGGLVFSGLSPCPTTDVIDQEWFQSGFILLICQLVNRTSSNQSPGVVHSYRSVCIFITLVDADPPFKMYQTGLNYPKSSKMIQKGHYIQKWQNSFVKIIQNSQHYPKPPHLVWMTWHVPNNQNIPQVIKITQRKKEKIFFFYIKSLDSCFIVIS